MNKLILILLVLSNTITLFGQELIQKTEHVNNPEGIAYFYVLKSKPHIKHGEYVIKNYSDEKSDNKEEIDTTRHTYVTGTYANNKKVGLWKERFESNECAGPKSSGYYENDLKVGEWFYFDCAGDTSQIFNWSENKLVFSKACGEDTSLYTVVEDFNETQQQLDCPPSCASTLVHFQNYFCNEVNIYRDQFKRTGFNTYTLKTTITITIDKNTSITEIAYSNRQSQKIKNIIEKIIKEYQWIPAVNDGKNVTSKFSFSINLSVRYS